MPRAATTSGTSSTGGVVWCGVVWCAITTVQLQVRSGCSARSSAFLCIQSRAQSAPPSKQELDPPMEEPVVRSVRSSSTSIGSGTSQLQIVLLVPDDSDDGRERVRYSLLVITRYRRGSPRACTSPHHLAHLRSSNVHTHTHPVSAFAVCLS
jgi:hypothetical protein